MGGGKEDQPHRRLGLGWRDSPGSVSRGKKDGEPGIGLKDLRPLGG